MRDVLGTGSVLGYCTNVHAGASLEQLRANLEQYALPIKQLVSPDQPMGIGLWIAAEAASQLVQSDSAGELRQALDELGLHAFTCNGFPYSDFHQPHVKYSVYQPTWANPKRLEYTIDLALIMAELADDEASISTLPLGWPTDYIRPDVLPTALQHLRDIAVHLHWIEQERGVTIHLDIEPEPGCFVQDSVSLVQTLERLYQGKDAEHAQRHLRVCHDICHAAVMFEDQSEAFQRYRAAGIRIGKVQISNAIRADMRHRSARERTDIIAQLRQFSEDRYLHQTMIRSGDSLQLFDDLPTALEAVGDTDRAGDEWRVHFHVPVDLRECGLLQTTQEQIIECMQWLAGSDVRHWEVETYAWNVLPDELKVSNLADGIARELRWVQRQATNMR